jgi:hypothetical protein
VVRVLILCAVLLFCFSANSAQGAVIVSTVGDEDALGTGTAPGGMLPSGPFDNRSAGEMAAMDGSQDTDLATGAGGINIDAAFLHTFTLPGGLGIGHAVLELGIGGMESNDSNPATSGIGEDALRIDGVLVPNAFAGVDQGSLGYDILTIVLPQFVLSAFNDGAVTVQIDLNSNAGFGPSSRIEPIFYDFSRLTLTQVPEPSSAWLIAAGAGALGLARTRKRSV